MYILIEGIVHEAVEGKHLWECWLTQKKVVDLLNKKDEEIKALKNKIK